MKVQMKIVVIVCLLISFNAIAAMQLDVTPAGDAQYGWNTKYGPNGYTTGENTMGIYLYFGSPYGNDYTVAIFEVPIAALVGQTLTSAMLEVESLGFDTNYYYGSAKIGWVNTGTRTLTGDVVADDIGSMKPTSGTYEIWDSDNGADVAGLRTFDFTTQVQADIDADRSYSTFVLCGSRETYGSIYTAESGCGPRLIATVPEPATLVLLSLGGLLLRKRK